MSEHKTIIPDGRLLNEEEAAKILGLKPVTLRRWRFVSRKPDAPERCKLPYTYTTTKRVRYRFIDLVKYLENKNTRKDIDMRQLLSDAYYASEDYHA